MFLLLSAALIRSCRLFWAVLGSTIVASLAAASHLTRAECKWAGAMWPLPEDAHQLASVILVSPCCAGLWLLVRHMGSQGRATSVAAAIILSIATPSYTLRLAALLASSVGFEFCALPR
jgi:hypothetical protein